MDWTNKKIKWSLLVDSVKSGPTGDLTVVTGEKMIVTGDIFALTGDKWIHHEKKLSGFWLEHQ